MKKKTNVILTVGLLALIFILSACGAATCDHVWREATCLDAMVCEKCGETSGEAAGHKWVEASCIKPKTCSVCGETEGEPLGHTWDEATCRQAKTCLKCGETEGDPLEHVWVDATCIEPQTCSLCGKTSGSALGHKVSNWTIVEDATCNCLGSQVGQCDRCKEEVSEAIPMIDHVVGEWEIFLEASIATSGIGTRQKKCSVCGEVIDTEIYTLTEEEMEQLYKKNCSTISYKDLARNPDTHEGELVKLKGEVIQVQEAQSALYYNVYRINVTKKRYYWTDTVYVTYDGYGASSRILDDDIVTFYGEYMGLKTYETIMGGSVTIPWVQAEYIDLD